MQINRFIYVINFMALLIFALCISPQTQAATSTTVINTFKLTAQNLTNKIQFGTCWTSSIAAPRSDAWRCTVGNNISDPCFVTKKTNTLVCDPNPITKKPGFTLHLTKPLPKQNTAILPQNEPINFWILAFEDGSYCMPYTGTLPLLHSNNSDKVIAVRYYCSDSIECKLNTNCNKQTGIIDESIKKSSLNNQNNLWTADKIIYTTQNNGVNTKITEIKKMVIKTVWK
jgi:hypothetical protein